ncbi:dihydroorotase [uncultured Desulfuromusa sp.]|uniref:dihydroorotase n=1 Tax=uncultured Desulfuromusa sp. TaxID=219183 RepID=UPI002AA65206|nr:dihydroorotase [uncultured Desulfuromusa sp.]
MNDQLTILAPDDFHVHFRDNDMLPETVAATARCFRRAIAMPNLVPPVTTAEMATAYRERIVAEIPQSRQLQPLMTIYLTDRTTPEMIRVAKSAGVVAAKLYPAGATTNSDSGVTALEKIFPALEEMSERRMLLLVHGEVTQAEIDIFDREKVFVATQLAQIVKRYPDLKVVAEHITTTEATQFVQSCGANVAATITPQHLLLNRNDLLVGGVQPHNYCLPILKRKTHQQALREVATSGSPKFFLGSDSAPHEQVKKENACGCAGCYSAWSALELYAQFFDEADALDKLEGFACRHGADFYQLPHNRETVTLIRESWTVPEQIILPNGRPIVPFFAGKQINWKLRPSRN